MSIKKQSVPRIAQPDQIKLSLADYRPRSGEPIRLSLSLPKVNYTCRYIGLVEDQGVMVSSPTARRIALTEGSPLQAKLLAGNTVINFQSRLLKIHYDPFPYWVLTYPSTIQTQMFRKQTRVPLHIKVLIDKGEEDPVPSRAAVCADISLHGASVESTYPLAEQGETVYMTARVDVAGLEQIIMVSAKVKSVIQSGSQQIKLYHHNIEFLDLDAETQLVLAGFVFQQWLYESGEMLFAETFYT